MMAEVFSAYMGQSLQGSSPTTNQNHHIFLHKVYSLFIVYLYIHTSILYINLKWGSRRVDRSAEDAFSSKAPDPIVAFVGVPCCPTLDFVIAFWIVITFYTLLTSLFVYVQFHLETNNYSKLVNKMNNYTEDFKVQHVVF
jgi:FtsH-binding integral membrane protein